MSSYIKLLKEVESRMNADSHSPISCCSTRVFTLSYRHQLAWVGLTVAFVVVLASNTLADVKLPGLFSDNMVLQQNLRVPIWGWADEGEQVTVAFRNSKSTTVVKGGKWQVTLGAFKAGGPDHLTVSGQNIITLTNVMVGEVWVCSGQSNMEWPLSSS